MVLTKIQKVTALIQARLGSTRLPGKTLMTIAGESLLGHLVKRVKASRYVNEIIIATTINYRDDAIVKFAVGNNLKFYRGSEEDVLERFYQAAVEYGIETIVRITPDCPMLDPEIMDAVISKYLEGNHNYVSNVLPPTFPDGLDTEVFSFRTLEKTWHEARLPSEREHVTPYIVKHPELFRHFNVKKEGEDLSWLRLTVDTRDDYDFVCKIFELLYHPNEIFHMEDVLALLKENPQLLKINSGILRNEGYKISLLKDNKYGT
jgi:spore coat polysaccharide biosynthesis protein SpsF (cytidylyltransferase family)